jgi:hypothetical protein
MCVISASYNSEDFITFEKKYESVPPGRVGISVTEYVDSSPLYDFDNNVIGTIQFNSIVSSIVTYPPFSNIVEQITIILDDGSVFFTNNQFSGVNGAIYEPGSKFILPIIEALGSSSVGKSGYVVIDAFEKTRNVYIKLE